jgi:hypothetical protein
LRNSSAKISDFISAAALAVALASGVMVGGDAGVGTGLVLVETDAVAGAILAFAAVGAMAGVGDGEVDILELWPAFALKIDEAAARD